MLTALSFLGRLAWPVLGSLVPGMSPRLVMYLAGLLAVLVAVGGPAGAVWLHMHGARGEAIKAENARCELRIAEGAAASAESLSHLLDIINKGEQDVAEPVSKADELALCRKSKMCLEASK